MQLSFVLHIAFYYAGVISLMLGIYILTINPRERVNQAFLAMCLSLSVWSFGFSMSINAETLENCLFWRRISAIGWSVFFTALLCFCLVFTKKAYLLNRWFLRVSLFIPALLCIYLFSYSTDANNQYRFISSYAGWVNTGVFTPSNIFFYIYFLSFTLLSLSLLVYHRYTTSDLQVHHQSRLILKSFGFAAALGFVTDFLITLLPNLHHPQVVPIIMLIPLMTIYYAISRYGLFRPYLSNESEMMLSTSTQSNVYNNISIALAAGAGVIYLVQILMIQQPFPPVIPALSVLALAGLIQLLKNLRLTSLQRDPLLIALLFVTAPLIQLIFIQYGAVTVWASSFMIIVIAMVFNRPIVLASVSFSVVSTQILIWLSLPEVKVRLNQVDYAGRIGILCITIWLAYHINNIYISRLKKNAEQFNIQRFVSEVSSDFINVNQSNVDEKMQWVIRIIGKISNLDIISTINIHQESQQVESVTVVGPRRISETRAFSLDELRWLADKYLIREFYFVPEVSDLPPEADNFKQWLCESNVSSFLFLPISESTAKVTALLFATTRRKEWSDEEIRTIRIVSNLFSDALIKVDAEKEISYMAYHDHLTGLPNRRLLRDRLEQSIALARRTNRQLGMIFIDLDSFKSVNDALGHEGGDHLLTLVSEKLSRLLRKSDTVARFGGDEYIILLNSITGNDNSITVAEKIMEVLREPYIIEGQSFTLTASIGISMYPDDGSDLDSLVKNADIAMYKAKENGKNQYVLCTNVLKDEMNQKLKMTNCLSRALERQEFYLHYQPQVELSTGKIIGLEALIRWRSPELGFVSPAVFIPLAEQMGLIGDIGEWVLKEACTQNKAWQDAGLTPVRMAVNVSSFQLRNHPFVARVRDVIQSTGLLPEYVEIEITESAAMSEATDMTAIMNDIRNLGIVIAIDDFGTDYSSLSRLKELPIDKIKIDKKFVDGIDVSDKDKAIVRTIINLAKNLELKVIAEGVELESQLNFLRQEQCDEVQGYYYYKPVPADVVDTLLAAPLPE